MANNPNADLASFVVKQLFERGKKAVGDFIDTMNDPVVKVEPVPDPQEDTSVPVVPKNRDDITSALHTWLNEQKALKLKMVHRHAKAGSKKLSHIITVTAPDDTEYDIRVSERD